MHLMVMHMYMYTGYQMVCVVEWTAEADQRERGEIGHFRLEIRELMLTVCATSTKLTHC